MTEYEKSEKAEFPEKSRQYVLSYWTNYVRQHEWNLGHPPPVVYAVTAHSHENVWKVCENGIPVQDDGQYGKGIYLTTYTPYAAKDLPSSELVAFVVHLAALGSIYPVIEHPKQENSLLGKPIAEEYDAHVVLTNANGEPYDFNTKGPLFDELVLSNENQAYPAYVVFAKQKDQIPENTQVSEEVNEESIVDWILQKKNRTDNLLLSK
eukprot:TRINITY_DN1844_c0_g5_i1.p1 TRINITY_DN1844_c0_g5~~TRINITY_DN1844_c0_g5_i1.p1  ORF type:complete len:220 (-),score=56.77 TRINITY_DN1844_c0_g5_i1:81-704(-)